MTESFNRKLGRLAQNVSGTGTITSNAATASAWQTARTITLGGDLSGSVSIDGSSNVSLTAIVSGDAVVLGTDTTGNYVATIAAGSGISVSGSGSETAAVTISIDNTVATLTGEQTLTNKTLTTPVISSITNTGTLTLPTSTDTLVGRATSDTLTNKTISGSNNTLSNIGNGSLTNSSITVNGTSIALGASGTLVTDDIAEDGTPVNLWFTNTRARTAISATDAGGDGSFSYDSGTGVFTYTGPSATEVRAHLSAGTGLTYTTGQFSIDNTVATLTGSQTLTNKTISGADNTLSNIGNSSLTNSSITINGGSVSLGGTRTLVTDDIAEDGSPSNLWYTDTRSRAAISVTDAGGDGSLSYNSGSGVITYTGPSATEVRAHFSAGTGVTISSGQISIGQAVATTDNVTFAGVTADNIRVGVTGANEIDTSSGNLTIDSTGGTTVMDDDVNVTGNLLVDGNLTVSGTTVTVNTTNLAVEDNMIYLNNGSAVTNPDLGFAGNYNDGTYRHAGVFRDASDGVWKFFHQYTPEPDASPYIDITHGSFALAPVQASSVTATTFSGALTGNVTGNASTATAWQTARTLTLSGDVTGTSAAFDGSGNISITTTIAADSVALGTDTTGNYVASITNGSYITGGNGGSEGAALTLAVDATSANTASKVVARDSSGNFSAGTITASLSGNASTATAWATARTLTLSGDVTGTSAAFDGSGNVSITTTIAANSVALGTDTTGDYVAAVAVAGTGLSVAGTGENATYTITSNATSANTASTIVARDASGNFTAGTITAALSGNATTATNISGYSGTYWTSDNDGAGSGLDADLVDGLQASSFMRSAGTENNGTIIIRDNRSTTNYYNTVALEIRSSDQKAVIGLHRDGFSHVGIAHEVSNQLRFNFNSGDVYINSGAGTLWGSGNDGVSSGLDADLLDGQQGAYYAAASSLSSYLPLSGGMITGNLGVQTGYFQLVTGSILASNASTRGFIMDGNYTNGQFRHRWRKYDDGNGIPLYLDYAHATADSYIAIARFGGGGTYRELDVYGTFSATTVLQGTNQVLHAGNYNSYSPTLTGTGASGTWGISVTGNAATTTILKTVNTTSTSASTWNPQSLTYQAWGQGFTHSSISGDSGDLVLWLRASQYSGGGTELCMIIDGDYFAGTGQHKVLHAGNYNSYSPTLTGTGASGTWGINVTGTAGSISGFNNPTTASTANTIAYRNSLGDIAVRELILEVGVQSFTPSSMVAIYPTTNQAVKVDAAGARNFLDVPTRSGGNASGTWSINVTGSAGSSTSASYARYIPTYYIGDRQLNPQTYFNNGVGLNVAMTGAVGYWTDTLWINGYSGGDVLSMCALHTSRNGAPTMWISTQQSTATSYGTFYEFLTAYNYTNYSPSLTGGGASGTWNININGVINTTAAGGSIIIKHSVSEVDAWIFQENAANWGLYWKNAPSGQHTFGGYTSVGAELVGMSAVNASGNGVATTNYVGATSAVAQWMLSNYTGYMWSASTMQAATSIVAPIGIFTNDGASRVLYLRGAGNIIQFQDGSANNKWEVVGREGTFYIYKNDGTGTGYRYQIDSSGNSTCSGTWNFNSAVNSPSGYVSIGNPWGTANSAWFGNGITTAGSTNWIYGHCYLGNAPSNGSGAQVESNGKYYSSVSSGIAMYVRSTRVGGSGEASNSTTLLCEQTRGDHSWGIVGEFRIGSGAGSDRPSILFSTEYNTDTWTVGFGYTDSNFRINRDHGWRQSSWGTTLMVMDRSGNVTFTGNVTAYSDRRLKTDIEKIDNAIHLVKMLEGVTFKYKEDGRDGVGLIAQDVEKILPAVVGEATTSTGDTYKNVAYGNIVAVLIEAIKEQQSEIDELKNRLNKL